MIALIQRVLEAKVEVSGDSVGSIGRGMLALIPFVALRYPIKKIADTG